MKFLSSAQSVSVQCGISGGSMASGEKLEGNVIVDIPLAPQISFVDDTVFFTQNPRKVYKFGDCEHFKISGMVYRPSNFGGVVKPSSSASVFGPMYDQEGVGRNLLLRTATSFESWPHLFGRYNNLEEGTWVFALGVRRVGNRVFSATGSPDLQGSDHYRGRYSFRLQEFRVVGRSVQYREVSIYTDSTWQTPHTSACSPFQALDLFKSDLLTEIEKSNWREWNSVYSMSPISPCNLQFPNVHQVFPADDMSVNWGELAADAYSSVPFFSSNGIAYANDLIRLKRSAQQTLSLIKSFGKVGKYANKVANLFLSFYYGWRLFVSDTQELYGAIEKRKNSYNFLNRATSQRSWGAHGATYLATFQCYYNRYSKATDLDRFILDYDLALTPENLWDLVPFSFVVDWFIGVGEVLENASNYYAFTQMHEVLCSGRSIKAMKHVDASKLHPGWCGAINCSYYHRSYTPTAYRPTFSFSNSVNPLDHLVEGSALIVSRR